MLKDLCFEIIQKCPNNCLFCSSMSCNNSTCMISLEDFKRTIDKFVSLGGIEELSLSGGEPFLHPNLLEMVEYSKKNGIKTVIYTSGIVERTFISEEEKEKLNPSELRIINQVEKDKYNHLDRALLRKLKEVGLDKIVFDFQSSEEDEYNYLMGTKNQYNNVLSSIIYALSAKIETEFHFVPLKANYKMFKDVIELAEIGEVKKVSVLRFVPQGRGRDNANDLMLSKEELEEFKDIIKNIKPSKVQVRMGIPMTDKDTHLCTAGYDKLSIRYDGAILPCPSFKDLDISLLEQYGYKVHNIHSDLDDITISTGSRSTPLCKKIHFR